MQSLLNGMERGLKKVFNDPKTASVVGVAAVFVAVLKARAEDRATGRL